MKDQDSNSISKIGNRLDPSTLQIIHITIHPSIHPSIQLSIQPSMHRCSDAACFSTFSTDQPSNQHSINIQINIEPTSNPTQHNINHITHSALQLYTAQRAERCTKVQMYSRIVQRRPSPDSFRRIDLIDQSKATQTESVPGR
jgi:hypothetical protein